MSQHDFPYTMRDVAALLPLHIRRRRAVSIDADCPFCGDTKGKLNINFEKQVFNCNRCRTHGGMVELYAKFFGVSNTQANAEIFSIVCRHETPRIAPTPIASPKELPREASRADAQAIDQTFRTLLAMLPLAESHRSDLHRRGLNDDQIEQYLYRSVPAFGYRALTGQLLQMGCRLEGVPGFYQDEQKDWTLACSPRRTGYFVPVISVDGLLQGCQIRMDHPGKQGGKYIWLSSAERNGGVTSGSPVHFVGDPAADTVWITEGPLKATVAHCLSGHSFLAVAGANQLNSLPDSLALLKRFGCRTVCEAFDMDKLQNPHVASGTAKVLHLAKSMGFDVRQIRWNPQYKGIDDYLLSKQKNHNTNNEGRMAIVTRPSLCKESTMDIRANDAEILCKELEKSALGPDDTFSFSCDRCGRCCRSRDDILLNPGDLFRIASFFNSTPHQIVEQYCECYIGPDSRLPIIRLKPKTYRSTCPFLGSGGCKVHQAKPTVCALFPLGRAYLTTKGELIYFCQPVTCGSRKETHTVREWLTGFGLSYEDDDALHWMRLTPRLTIWMRQNEFRLSQPERLTVWTHMKNLCYLQYDIHGPFHGQFLRNTNELLRMLSDI